MCCDRLQRGRCGLAGGPRGSGLCIQASLRELTPETPGQTGVGTAGLTLTATPECFRTCPCAGQKRVTCAVRWAGAGVAGQPGGGRDAAVTAHASWREGGLAWPASGEGACGA